MSITSLQALLQGYKGKCASVNSRESEHYGWMVVDIEPKKPPAKSIFLIHDVTDDMLVLDYFGMQEIHYIPLDKIIKVNVILREK
jgi:hypothetical protein